MSRSRDHFTDGCSAGIAKYHTSLVVLYVLDYRDHLVAAAGLLLLGLLGRRVDDDPHDDDDACLSSILLMQLI